MKMFVLAVVAAVAVLSSGCEKKQAMTDEMQEPLSMAALSTLANETAARAQGSTNQGPGASVATAPQTMGAAEGTIKPEVRLEPLPPAGPYKPTVQEIQTALKNAGLYGGEVDGKAGPKTKAAIEEFQKANNLKVDGKVGPQTWAALSTYAASVAVDAPVVSEKKSKKRR